MRYIREWWSPGIVSSHCQILLTKVLKISGRRIAIGKIRIFLSIFGFQKVAWNIEIVVNAVEDQFGAIEQVTAISNTLQDLGAVGKFWLVVFGVREGLYLVDHVAKSRQASATVP